MYFFLHWTEIQTFGQISLVRSVEDFQLQLAGVHANTLPCLSSLKSQQLSHTLGDFPELMFISQVQTVTPVLQADWIWASSSLEAIWLD